MVEEKRNIAALAAFNAFRGLAIGGYMALFPMYMRSLGYSMDYIGGVIAVASILMALAMPAVGAVIDYHGPKRMVVLTGAAVAVAAILAAGGEGVAVLAASYTVFLFSFMAGQPARMAFLAASIDVGRMGRYVGITSSVFSAFHTVGPAAGGLVAERLGYPQAFAGMALIAAAGLLVFLVLSKPVDTGVRVSSLPDEVRRSYARSLRPGRRFASLLAFIALDRAAWTLWFPLLSAHLYNAGFGEAEVGFLMSLMGTVRTLAMPLAGLLVDRLGSWAAIAASEALGSLVAAVLAMGDGFPSTAAAMAILGVSISLWVPGYNAAIARIAGGTGEAYATANMVRSVAGAPGPYVGGLIYEAINGLAPFAVSSALLVVAALAALTVIRRSERGVTRTGPIR